MRDLQTLTEQEQHAQAVARAFLYRRPHTRIIPGGLPVTHFRDRLPYPQSQDWKALARYHGGLFVRECNVCKLLRGISIPAVYDARIPLAGWADLCQTCFDNLGCKLGSKL